MKIKIIFSVLSAAFFGIGLTALFSDNSSSGAVLGEVSMTVPTTAASNTVPIVSDSTSVVSKLAPSESTVEPVSTSVSTTASTSNANVSSGVDLNLATDSALSSVSSSPSDATASSPRTNVKTDVVVPAPVEKRVSPTTGSVGIQSRPAPIDARPVMNRKMETEAVRNSGTTLSDRDTDADGLSDADEIRIGSNPFNEDTDGDGFKDGEEVRKGFNPLKSAVSDRGDKVVFESPKEKRITKVAVEDKRLRVERVERVALEDGRAVTRISGKGLPNSFLTLYVYSNPIVVTVKTDGDGNWSYELDRDLEDGKHEVYVAVTDATGRISAQSKPIPFVKTAQAISVGSSAELERESKGNQSPVELVGAPFAFVGIAVAIMMLLSLFYFIGHRAFVD